MKKFVAIVLSMLLVLGVVFTATAETETQPEPALDEAAILDAMAKDWLITCEKNQEMCLVGMDVYWLGQPAEWFKGALMEDIANNIKAVYAGSPGVQFPLEVDDLNKMFGDDSLSRNVHVYLLNEGAQYGTDEYSAFLTAKGNIFDTIKNKKIIENIDVLDIIEKNYTYAVGEVFCLMAIDEFEQAMDAQDLGTKREHMLKGAMLATQGCNMSIQSTDALIRVDTELSVEEIMVQLANVGTDLVGELVPAIDVATTCINVTLDITIKTLAINNKMDALSGFMEAPWTIEGDLSGYYNALSNQYGKYTFNISESLEVEMGKYNGYLDIREIYEEVTVPEKLYGAFPVVAFGGTFVNGQDITKITIPSTIRQTLGSAAVIKNCDKLQEVRYNATDCQVGWLGSFISGCDSEFVVKFGPDIVTIPERFLVSCGIKEIKFPEGVTAIYSGAVLRCPNIETITIPSTVQEFIFARDPIVGECPKLNKLYYNAVEASGGYAYAVIADCGNEAETMSIIIGDMVKSTPSTFIRNCGVNSIEFPEGMTTLREYAIIGCSRLETITIPSTVTTLGVNTVADYIFINCSGLKTVNYNAVSGASSFTGTIFESIQSDFKVNFGAQVQTIPEGFLSNCGLREIAFPEGLKYISGNCLVNCDNLKTVVVPTTVETIGYNFISGCGSIETVYFNANCTTSPPAGAMINDSGDMTNPKMQVVLGNNVTTVPGRFISNCAITEFVYPEGVKVINGNSIRDCKELLRVVIPSTVEQMGAGVVQKCNALLTVEYYAKNASRTADSYGYVFDSCGNDAGMSFVFKGAVQTLPNSLIYNCGISALEIPDTVTAIPGYLVHGCSDFTSLTIGAGVTSFANRAFSDCHYLTEIYYNAINASDKSSSNFVFYDGGNKGSGIQVVIGRQVQRIPAYLFCPVGIDYGGAPKITDVAFEAGSSCTTIGNAAFASCTALPTVTIPGTVTDIGQHAFANCTALTEIRFNAEKMNNLQNDNYIFLNAGKNASGINVIIGKQVQQIPAYLFYSNEVAAKRPNIKSVEFEKGSVCTTIGRASFYGLPSLTEVQLPKSLETIEINAFNSCTNMTRLRFAAVNLQAPLWKNNAFGGCGSEGAGICLIIESGVTQIPAGMFSATGYPENVAKIVSLEFEKGSACTAIGEGAFSDLTTLTTAKLAPSVTVIKPTTFMGCTALKNVELSPRTTMIGTSAFEGCIGLTGISLPEKLSHIEKDAFKGCTGLTAVEFPAGVTSVGGGSFADCANLKQLTFTGAAPKIWTAFEGVTATAYYPVWEATWTVDVRKDYGGTITWVGEKCDIDVSRMILGNSLEFQFGVAKSKFTDLTGMYAVVQRGAVTKTIPASQWGSAGVYWAITYDDLAAKEMADEISVTIYNADGDAVSEPKTDSVRAYVARAFADQTDKGKTMLVDMLNYGAAAQVSFEYNTGDLANSQLTDAQKAYATAKAPAISNKLVTGTNYKGTRLVLESRIQMQVAFTGMNRSMYAVYSYTDHNGKAQTVTVNGEDFIEVNGIFGIELSQLVYADARTMVTIQIYNSKGKLLSTVKDSMESYASRTSTDAALIEALMKFADSAKEYLHQ